MTQRSISHGQSAYVKSVNVNRPIMGSLGGIPVHHGAIVSQVSPGNTSSPMVYPSGS